ncbi:MAG: alpha/beta hydrolase [Alphaproteobacteria bacterium]|nr:alpha/beta hydrolase [Alphaproteobacteria bacterium]
MASPLTIDGRTVDYQETGDGPAILFVPGSYSTPAAWLGVQRELSSGYRFVSTSLCGYGATNETRNLGDLDIEHEVRVVAAVAEQVGAPVHLVGHSFGATVALAAALANEFEVLSITTFEANPIALVRERGQMDLYESVTQMNSAFEAAYNAGERDAAGRIIDFWGHDGAFAAMPEVVQDYCRSTTFANVLDWRTAFGFEASMSDYAQLTMPVLLARGGLANPAMVEITAALEAALPNVRPEVIDGAGHFLISSHAKDCSQILSDFLAVV